MTREEKAKAYDEAIAKAQKELQTCGSTDCDAARQIYRFFPELKENEDERIRKSIIAILNNYVDNSNTFKPKMLSWLEKQADKDKLIKELGKYKAKYTQEVLQNHLNSITNKDDERLRKTTIAFLKEFADKGYENAVECIDWLEKQGESDETKAKKFLINKGYPIDANGTFPTYEEIYNIIREGIEKQGRQSLIEEKSPAESLGISPEKYEEIVNECIYGEEKPTNKAEPKFKVGDWVKVSTTKGDKVVQIASVEYFKNGYPSYTTTEGRWFGNGTKARLLTDKDTETITLPESKVIVNKIILDGW